MSATGTCGGRYTTAKHLRHHSQSFSAASKSNGEFEQGIDPHRCFVRTGCDARRFLAGELAAKIANDRTLCHEFDFCICISLQNIKRPLSRFGQQIHADAEETFEFFEWLLRNQFNREEIVLSIELLCGDHGIPFAPPLLLRCLL